MTPNGCRRVSPGAILATPQKITIRKTEDLKTVSPYLTSNEDLDVSGCIMYSVFPLQGHKVSKIIPFER